ncbi:MAG: thiamine-phosphate kinase [Aaplasma endosymbiont of Hyalomma asiaticum]
MDEFYCIEKYIRPLLHSGIQSENDDSAHIQVPKRSLIATKDIIVEGVHFLSGADPLFLAKKALRVNLSDLASMGAVPHSYLLGLSLPKNTCKTWWKRFSKGLKEDNELYSIKLVGGDTTSNLSNIIVISITALGIPSDKVLTRSGAKIGDILYVSGTIGDATLGLMAYKSQIHGKCIYVKRRYDLPVPRVSLGTEIAGIATACIDISDGLLQDVKKLCHLSRVGANINADSIPLSTEAQSLIKGNIDLFEDAIAGGDDYELAFTVPAGDCHVVESIASSIGVRISKIGVISQEKTVSVYDKYGKNMSITKRGYTHNFLGNH